MTDEELVERIAKINATKAHGHIDSAVSHCAALLGVIQRLRTELAEAKARASVVINAFKAWQKYEDGEIDQQTFESIIAGAERDMTHAAEWLGSYVNATIEELAETRVQRDNLAEALKAARPKEYLERQREWSRRTFGGGFRTIGITEHIHKELSEVRAKPEDLSEWIDVIILAMDGYWRHGGRPEDLMKDLQAKQDKNFARKWPAPGPQDKATEHIRE